MTLVKFNQPVNRGYNNFVEDFFTEFPTLFNESFNKSAWNGSVPANVKESNGAYQLEVVAPGFEKNDFKVNVDANILTVSVEKKTEDKNDSGNNQNERQVRNEYRYHSFKRSFTLDEKIDASNIDAKYINGVLTLNLPKKAEVKEATKEITIQ